jgi:DNA-binding NarL/FixJ family response regulator
LEGLSESEKLVLSLVMKGRTNKEIATQLDCSLRTVESRRHKILRLMQTDNAITLAALLGRHGMIDQIVEFTADAGPAGPHWISA